jgi:hypothetical protein
MTGVGLLDGRRLRPETDDLPAESSIEQRDRPVGHEPPRVPTLPVAWTWTSDSGEDDLPDPPPASGAFVRAFAWARLLGA